MIKWKSRYLILIVFCEKLLKISANGVKRIQRNELICKAALIMVIGDNEK